MGLNQMIVRVAALEKENSELKAELKAIKAEVEPEKVDSEEVESEEVDETE